MGKKDIIKHQFKKGESGNLKGRPRKWVSTLTDQGYKMSEVRDCILALMAMTLNELEGAKDNPSATVMELTVINAIKKGIDNGDLYPMESLMNRVFGRPIPTLNYNIQEEQKEMRIVIVKNKDKVHVTKWS